MSSYILYFVIPIIIIITIFLIILFFHSISCPKGYEFIYEPQSYSISTDAARTKYIVEENKNPSITNQLKSNVSSPIKLDRHKYAVGQIVHISGKISNNDISIDNNGQIQIDIGRGINNNGQIHVHIERTHYSDFPVGCYKPLQTNQNNIHVALVELKDGSYQYNYIPSQPGIYTASIVLPSTEETFRTIFEVINPLFSINVLMLIIAIVFVIALISLNIIISIINKILNKDIIPKIKCKSEKYLNHIEDTYQKEIKEIKDRYQKERKGFEDAYQKEIKEIEDEHERKMLPNIEIASSVRFLLISAFIGSIISSLVFIEVEVGTHSPLGLVLRHNLNPEEDVLDTNKNPLIDWVVNIGGSWENNFSSGVVIPVYVFILGLIGGYLRYLNKAMSKEKNIEKVETKSDTSALDKEPIETKVTTKPIKLIEKTSRDFAENTDGELSNILLAPLLAAVVWFIISQGDSEFNIYGMAAISFGIGLVTKEIIQIIVKIMEKIIPS